MKPLKIATTPLPLSRSLTAALALAFSVLATPATRAQFTPVASSPMLSAAAPELPNAPGVSSSLDNAPALAGNAQAPTQRMASHTEKYIDPGESAPSISAGDKFALGFKDAFSPFSFVGWAASAGYEQATNGSPNYGTNAIAFGKRFGASAARASSEGVFSDSIMAPILHEDPRYYRMGSGHNVFKRAAYAATRTLITRTDSGRATPNFALLSGNLGGAYLTKAYYPDVNTTNSEVLKTFAGSVGGSALGFAVSEFFGDIFNFHKNKN